MDEQPHGFIDEVLGRRYGPQFDKSPRLRRPEVEKLLTDNGWRRLSQAERAATEWGGTEFHGDVRIVAERVIITPHGLVYAAGLRGAERRDERSGAGRVGTMFYLATPRSSFDSLIDRVRITLANLDEEILQSLAEPWSSNTEMQRLDIDPGHLASGLG